MRTEQGKEFIKNLNHGQWVTRAQLYELFGSAAEFRRQVLEFRSELEPFLGAKCTKRGIEVRTSERVVEVGNDCRHAMGRMAKSQARKVSAVDTRELPDERRRQAEGAVAFFGVTAVMAANKELKGDVAAKLLGGGK